MLNVATPFTALVEVVPLRVAPLGLLRIATEMAAELDTELPNPS